MQEIAVALIVGAAVFSLARRMRRGLTSEKPSCGCHCAGCGKGSSPCQGQPPFPGAPDSR